MSDLKCLDLMKRICDTVWNSGRKSELEDINAGKISVGECYITETQIVLQEGVLD